MRRTTCSICHQPVPHPHVACPQCSAPSSRSFNSAAHAPAIGKRARLFTGGALVVAYALVSALLIYGITRS